MKNPSFVRGELGKGRTIIPHGYQISKGVLSMSGVPGQEQIIEYAINQNLGIFCILFIALLGVTVALVGWVMRQNNIRELRLQDCNKELAVSLNNATNTQTSLKRIEENTDELLRRVPPVGQPWGAR